jgi:DNA-binding transcriptional ArsR family regulator
MRLLGMLVKQRFDSPFACRAAALAKAGHSLAAPPARESFRSSPPQAGASSFDQHKINLDFVSVIYNHTVVDYLSATFAALSVPTRRRIIDRLTRGPATVNELAGPFSISQQAISKHLAYLERARLIKKQKKGRQHLCVLKPAAIRKVSDWSENYRALWEKRFRRLDTLLDEMKSQKLKR